MWTGTSFYVLNAWVDGWREIKDGSEERAAGGNLRML